LSFLVSISQTSAPHYIIFQLVSASETRLTLYHIRTLTPLTRSDIYGLNIHDKRSHFHHKRSKNPKDLFVPDLQRSLLAHSILRFNQLSIGYYGPITALDLLDYYWLLVSIGRILPTNIPLPLGVKLCSAHSVCVASNNHSSFSEHLSSTLVIPKNQSSVTILGIVT